MATTVTSTIGTGGDYSTAPAWEDAAPADLVAVDQIWRGELKHEEFIATDTVVSISGSTSDAARYKILTCEAGASFIDNIGASALRADATYGALIRKTGSYGAESVIISEPYARIVGVQITSPYWGNASERAALSIADVSAKIDQCVLEAYNSSSFGGVVQSYGGILANSLIVKRSSTGQIVSCGNSGQLNIYNCTLAVPSDLTPVTIGIGRSYGSVIIHNCAVFGATDISGTTGTLTATTSAGDDATPPTGVTGSLVYTDQFVNTLDATRDFRVKAGAFLVDNGTADAVNAAVDILGVSRPNGAAYDIGAQESGVSSDTTPDPFTFTNQTDVAVSTLITSNTITVTGIDASTPISITGGEYSVNAGAYTSTAGNVVVNDTVTLRLTSSASNSTLVSSTLDVGGVTDQWDVTTVAAVAGTITTEPLKNNTGTLLASESGAIVDIYDATSGALVLHATSETTDASGLLEITSASIIAATSYTVIVKLASGAIGVDEVTAT